MTLGSIRKRREIKRRESLRNSIMIMTLLSENAKMREKIGLSSVSDLSFLECGEKKNNQDMNEIIKENIRLHEKTGTPYTYHPSFSCCVPVQKIDYRKTDNGPKLVKRKK